MCRWVSGRKCPGDDKSQSVGDLGSVHEGQWGTRALFMRPWSQGVRGQRLTDGSDAVELTGLTRPLADTDVTMQHRSVF
ncbi:hypothetical protein EYF80_030228 [Liparis tanakae]|uniref:Uncharacterized protein n=1 Tax=Liparis tanakae TaxID=230148 RepID=A0A4Z2H150_9TELE|nr:hypothetical protein EYF80_030228 [Liparis tanakae]